MRTRRVSALQAAVLFTALMRGDNDSKQRLRGVVFAKQNCACHGVCCLCTSLPLLFVAVSCLRRVRALGRSSLFSFNCCTLLLLRCPFEMCPLYCTFFLYAEHHRCQNRTLERKKKKTRTREKEDEDKTVTRESAARWSTRWLFTSLAVTYKDADFFLHVLKGVGVLPPSLFRW